jgi:hypothetical protein
MTTKGKAGCGHDGPALPLTEALDGGHLFVSRDTGDSWQMAAGFLPLISSVLALAT